MSAPTSTKVEEPTRPAIDPRIRARRVEVQRTAGRRRLRRISWTMLALASVVAVVLAGASPLVDVDHLQVSGAEHTGAQAVLDRSGIARGDHMVTLPLHRAAVRVESLPWVRAVVVHRRWPGTVELHVTERTAVAAVPAVGGGFLLLDTDARQLEVVPAVPPGVLSVELDPVRARLGRTLLAERETLLVATSVPAVLRDRFLALRPIGEGRIEGVVKLRDGTSATVHLCTAERLPAKWLALVTLLDEAATARLATVDVCVPSAPVVTRR